MANEALDEILEGIRPARGGRPPKSVRVIGFTVPVVQADLSEAEVLGAYDPPGGQVVLHKDLPAETAKYTLVHELIHAVEHLLSIELTEQDISNLAAAFVSFVRDNPDLVAYIEGK